MYNTNDPSLFPQEAPSSITSTQIKGWVSLLELPSFMLNPPLTSWRIWILKPIPSSWMVVSDKVIIQYLGKTLVYEAPLLDPLLVPLK
ncbi:hypothetical protein HMI54_015608 [Coelomomyces lativittatus]|nr:hypothetical protein HMI55_001901 [Coelomomyces lativittatus]KAJ1512625.1 hypothetical protein HMI54_015608 [Coelomomyces lativittatus]